MVSTRSFGSESFDFGVPFATPLEEVGADIVRSDMRVRSFDEVFE